jgi:hypothetical protein
MLCLSLASDGAQEKPIEKIGYEILEVKSRKEIRAWATRDISQEQFDALKLPRGWVKNQPREVDMDNSRFHGSPRRKDGKIVTAEHFGFTWMHVATVVQVGVRVDPEKLLAGTKVQKNHEVAFDAGSTLKLLVSPQGEVFPRITRDAGRTRDVPRLPEGWRLIDYKTNEALEIQLPAEVLVIRADNQDSFQGPVVLELE